MHIFTQDWFKVIKIYVTAWDLSIFGGEGGAKCWLYFRFVLNILYIKFYISLRKCHIPALHWLVTKSWLNSTALVFRRSLAEITSLPGSPDMVFIIFCIHPQTYPKVVSQHKTNNYPFPTDCSSSSLQCLIINQFPAQLQSVSHSLCTSMSGMQLSHWKSWSIFSCGAVQCSECCTDKEQSRNHISLHSVRCIPE
jgi:hypothetical protein